MDIFPLRKDAFVVKVLAYNSAARGTGQFVRGLKLAATIVSAFGDARCVLLVGSNYVPRRCPANTTIIRMPEITKTLNGRAVCSTLNVERAFEIRQATIRNVISEFRPDVFLVDSRPLGLNGELLHSLQAIRARGECKIMLILRDIVDQPALVKARWRDESVYEAIENLYDKVVFLGEESIYNAAEMYGLTSFGNKVIYAGYLGDRVTHVADQRPRHHGSDAMNSVLVTVGGGYDGDRLVRALCCYIESIADAQRYISFKIVLGCNSPLSRKTLVAEYPRITRDAEIIAYLDDLTALIAEADLVITMCGYNTLTEALAHRKKLIAVPRSHSGCEQILRAEAVARAYDGIWVLPEHNLSTEAIGQALRSGLDAPPPRLEIEMSGNARLVELLKNEVQHARR
jgi:predicted glycosyltransferase